MTTKDIHDGLVDFYAKYLTVTQKLIRLKSDDLGDERVENLTNEQLLNIIQHAFTAGFVISNATETITNSHACEAVANEYIKIMTDNLAQFIPIGQDNEDY